MLSETAMSLRFKCVRTQTLPQTGQAVMAIASVK